MGTINTLSILIHNLGDGNMSNQKRENGVQKNTSKKTQTETHKGKSKRTVKTKVKTKVKKTEKSSLEEKDEQTMEEEKDEQLEEILEENVNIPKDARTIWAIQRFFLFSVVLTAFKISAYYLSGAQYVSIQAISIDAGLDLIVSGLGIYLIQWQRQVIKKVHDGTQEISVNKVGALGITTIQGVILFVGGIVIIVQSGVKMSALNSPLEEDPISVTMSYPVQSALILATILAIKFYLYLWLNRDAKITNNMAVKSLMTNIKIDIICVFSSWFVLIMTSLWYTPWIYFDPLIGILLGIWMIYHGLRYLYPMLKYFSVKTAVHQDHEGVEQVKEVKQIGEVGE